MSNPLLSICIPTYNRASILDENLNRITSNKAFDETVEIVISDNCSTDNTEEICKKYASQFSNVKYFRNETNIIDANFWTALQRGSGEYVKLQNDYLTFTDDGLQILKDNLKKYHKKQIFFTGNTIFTYKNLGTVECKDLNDYIKYVSTYVTFISVFGTWKENLSSVENPFEKKEMKLTQVDWTYQLLSKINESIVVNDKVYEWLPISGTGRYNWFKIHIQNYYEIMFPYIAQGYISKKTYKKDISNALFHFKKELHRTFIYTPKTYLFDKTDSFKVLFKYCKTSPRFWFYLSLFPIFKLFSLYYVIRDFIKKNFPCLFTKLKKILVFFKLR